MYIIDMRMEAAYVVYVSSEIFFGLLILNYKTYSYHLIHVECRL